MAQPNIHLDASHSLVTGENVQQRTLAGPGRSHDGRQLLRPEAAADPLENVLFICEMERGMEVLRTKYAMGEVCVYPLRR